MRLGPQGQLWTSDTLSLVVTDDQDLRRPSPRRLRVRTETDLTRLVTRDSVTEDGRMTSRVRTTFSYYLKMRFVLEEFYSMWLVIGAVVDR